MTRPLLIAALLPLAGCMSLEDYGEAPGTARYERGYNDYARYPGQPGWWGTDAASVDIFFGSLGNYGRWDQHPSYGRIWYPGGVGAGWQPYTSGRWVNDPRYGTRWLSSDRFGFATDHYGNWRRDPRAGWFWVPGTRFSSGWGSPPLGWRPPSANHPAWRPDRRPGYDRPDRERPDVGRPTYQRPDRPVAGLPQNPRAGRPADRDVDGRRGDWDEGDRPRFDRSRGEGRVPGFQRPERDGARAARQQAAAASDTGVPAAAPMPRAERVERAPRAERQDAAPRPERQRRESAPARSRVEPRVDSPEP